MKIKVFAIALCIAMIFSSISVFAIKEVRNGGTLFAEDFESYTNGGAITSIMGSNGTAASTTSAIAAANDNSEGSQNKTTFGELIKGAKLGVIFNDATISSGKFAIEFDGKLVAGNIWLSLLYSGSIGTRQKWFAGSDTADLCTITEKTDVPGSTKPGYQKFKDEEEKTLSFNKNGWSHYKFVVDMDNNSVTAFMDDIKSTTVTGYTFISGQTIAGIGIYNAAGASRYIDNLKIYSIGDQYGITILSEDFENDTIGSAPARFNILSSLDANDKIPVTTDTKATVKNNTKVMEVKYATTGAWIPFDDGRKINSGKFVIDYDALTNAGALWMGLHLEGGSAYRINDILVGSGTGNLYTFTKNLGDKAPATNLDAATYGTQAFVDSTGTEIAKSDGNSQVKWAHYTVTVDVDNSSVVVKRDGIESKPVTGYEFISNTKNILGIGFRNSNGNSAANQRYIDNIRVTIPTDGKSITNIDNGLKKLRLTFKDEIDASTVNDSAITVKKDTQTVAISSIAVDSSDKKVITVKMNEALDTDSTYTLSLSDKIKYTDGYPVIERDYSVDIDKAECKALIDIKDENYTSGSDISADFKINTIEMEQRVVQFRLAAYDDDKLVCETKQEVTVPETQYGEGQTYNVRLTLPGNVDTIRAFAWDDELTPYSDKAERVKD